MVASVISISIPWRPDRLDDEIQNRRTIDDAEHTAWGCAAVFTGVAIVSAETPRSQLRVRVTIGCRCGAGFISAERRSVGVEVRAARVRFPTACGPPCR